MTYISILLALMLQQSFQAFLPTVSPNHEQTCSGFYYEGVNSMFVDCYDKIGNLISQNENFFEFSLVPVCSTNMTFADISDQVMGWKIPTTVTNTTALSCCDYYQRTVGYVFTQCDQGINAIILANKFNTTENTDFQAMTDEFIPLTWDWTELTNLLTTYCSDSEIDNFRAYWQKLDLAWDTWLAFAKEFPDMATWDLNVFKQWLINYQNAFNALDNFIQQLSGQPAGSQANDTGVVANDTGVVANGTNSTSGRALFWLPIYDTDQFTVDDVKAVITGNGIMSGLQKFFEAAFGANGFVTMNTTIDSNSTIPIGLEQIVAWISMRVDIEARDRCTECQLAGVTPIPVTNVTLPATGQNVSGINQTNVSAQTNGTNVSAASNVTSNVTDGGAAAGAAAGNQTASTVNTTAGNATAGGNQTVVNATGATTSASGAAANGTASTANATAGNTSVAANSTGGQ